MPTVTIRLPSAVKFNALRIIFENFCSFNIRASAGVTTMFASGLTEEIFQQAYAIHGAVLRGSGSARICPAGTSGSCSFTIPT